MKTEKSSTTGDGRSSGSSLFHRSFPNSFGAHLEDIQQHSQACLSAMNILCQSGAQMAEAFTAAFHDTPFAEVSTRMRQVAQDLESRTNNASVHVQEDGVAMVTRLLERGTKDKTDESMQTMAHCFLLMLQSQYQFFQSASELFSPLGRYQEVEDILLGDGCEPSVREACSSWLSASQATSSLRRGEGLSREELQLLSDESRHRGTQSEQTLAEIRQKVDALSLIYKYEFAILPCNEFTVKAGFHQNLQSLALVLRGSCTQSEAEEISALQSNILLHTAFEAGAGSQSQQQGRSLDNLRGKLQTELQDVTLQVEGKPCKQAASLTENLQFKWDAVEAAVKEASKQCGLSIDVNNTTLCVLCHVSPSVSHHQSMTAVQMLFGRAYLVTVKPAKLEGGYQKYAQVSSHEGSITVEVPAIWNICGLPEWQHLQQTAGATEANLGKAEVVYTARISLVGLADGCKPDLPTIRVKVCRNEQCSPPPGHGMQLQRDPAVPQNSAKRLRNSMRRLSNKFTGVEDTDDDDGEEHHREPTTEGSRSQSESDGSPRDAYDDQVTIPEDNNNDMVLNKDDFDGIPPAITTGWKPGMVNPTVTITSEASPTEEHYHWSKTPVAMDACLDSKGLVSDSEVQDIVDFLSGVRKPPLTHLDPHLKSPLIDSITPTSSSSGSSKDSAGIGGWGTTSEQHSPATLGNYNPAYNDIDNFDSAKSIQGENNRMVAPSTWPDRTSHQQSVSFLQSAGDISANPKVMSGIENCTTDVEYAQYIAANFLGKRSIGPADELNLATNPSQWGYPDRLNRTWPHDKVIDGHEVAHQSWSAAHDSPGSSSDESSNGETAFSMGLGLTGPKFMASVSRRRHSSGGEDALHGGKPYDPNLDMGVRYLDVIQSDQTLMRTWPPKLAGQYSQHAHSQQTPPQSYQIPPQEQLRVHAPLQPQWSDPVGLRPNPAMSLWPPAGGSTPVSPAASMNVLSLLPQTSLPSSPQTLSPQTSSPRAHPKLDRRYAYSQY